MPNCKDTKISIHPTTQYKKDIKKLNKQGFDLTLLYKVIDEYLLTKTPLPEEYKDHQLKGNYNNHRECHIGGRNSDWLLIYKLTDNLITLVRTGSHSELFKN